MFCIWETGSKVQLENKTCKIKKDILEKVWVHMRERREREREERKKREFDVPNTNAYYKVKILETECNWTKKKTDELMEQIILV